MPLSIARHCPEGSWDAGVQWPPSGMRHRVARSHRPLHGSTVIVRPGGCRAFSSLPPHARIVTLRAGVPAVRAITAGAPCHPQRAALQKQELGRCRRLAERIRGSGGQGPFRMPEH
jgi:hypothetical protein